MKLFDLKIKSPEKEYFKGKVLSLIAEAVDGKVEVLTDHAPFATVLKKGAIILQTETGEKKSIEASAGFLIVKNNCSTILLAT